MIIPVDFYSFQNKNIAVQSFEGRHSHHVKRNPNSIKNITKRMVLHRDAHKLDHPLLVKVNVNKFDDIYREDEFYLREGYHDTLSDSSTLFILSGEDIEAPYMKLKEENGQLRISCIDGRHRYRVLKDRGMKSMPITMSQDSERLARKYGLLAIDFNA